MNKLTNVVLHGDCLDLMETMADGSVDMILCDLPYGTIASAMGLYYRLRPSVGKLQASDTA